MKCRRNAAVLFCICVVVGLQMVQVFKQKFLESDYAVEELSSKLPDWVKEGKLDEGQHKKLINMLDAVKNLTTQRDLVLNKEISVIDSISLYSHKIIGPIINCNG